MERRLESILALHQAQGAEGTWNRSNYMCGLYNGLELAVAILENREPAYKSTHGVRSRKKNLKKRKSTDSYDHMSSEV